IMTTTTIPQVEEIYAKGFDANVTRRLVAYARPYRWKLVLAFLLMIVHSTAAVAGPYLVKVALDSGIAAGSEEVLSRTVLLYLVLALVQWLAIFLRVNVMARVGQAIIYDLRAN